MMTAFPREFVLDITVMSATNLGANQPARRVGPTKVKVSLTEDNENEMPFGETEDSIGCLEVECWFEFELRYSNNCFTRNSLASTLYGHSSSLSSCEPVTRQSC